MPSALTFDVSTRPLTPDEQARFAPDLEHLGLDAAVLDVLNASLAAPGPHSAPLLLRTRRGGELVGALLFVACRRAGRCVTRHPLGSRLLDLNPFPFFQWNRMSAAMDHHANPGFVAGGLERPELVDAALEHLTGRYPYGLLIDDPHTPIRLASADVAHLDYGVIDAGAFGADELIAASRHLGRKTRKFANKGGRVDVVEGPMPAPEREAVRRWIAGLDPEIRLGFQDAYPAMVAAGVARPGTVHALAYLDGAFVGNQSFVRSGARLVCLSGIFDRGRRSTYHAYENIILASVRYARARGLARIEYGPIVNPTKAKLMTGFSRSALRYYSRFASLRRGLAWLARRSRLGPERLADFIGLEPRRAPA